ncbi:MAG TPA: hypothetical protein VGJ44_28190 [Kribbellaceae bacterium]
MLVNVVRPRLRLRALHVDQLLVDGESGQDGGKGELRSELACVEPTRSGAAVADTERCPSQTVTFLER